MVAVGLVALNRRLGCLQRDLDENSEQMTLIREANNLFETLNATEKSLKLWKLFPTPDYKKLIEVQKNFLRYIFSLNCYLLFL